MRIIDWNEDYSACTLVKGFLWWKRYARVERGGWTAWRYVETREDVSLELANELTSARYDATRRRRLEIPWQRERPGAVPPMRILREHTRVDGEVLIRAMDAVRITKGV